MIAFSLFLTMMLVVATASFVDKPEDIFSSNSFMQEHHHIQRHLQNCDFASHGYALECIFGTTDGNEVKYLVPCPFNATSSADCLTDGARICYTYNSVPCLGSYYCAETASLALDCSNIFAESLGNTCSITDCNGDCIELVSEPVDYNTATADNTCFRGGVSENITCATDGSSCTVTNEWYDILADSTEIRVTGSRPTDATTLQTCLVEVVNGGTCPCSTDCPEFTMSIGYDCSAYSNDLCAIADCSGSCLGNNSVVAETANPMAVTTESPVQPPPTLTPQNTVTVSPVAVTAVPVSVMEPIDSMAPTPSTAAPMLTFVSIPPVTSESSPSQPPAYIVQPTTWGGDRECDQNSACQALNLTGLCCPTSNDDFLECCELEIINPPTTMPLNDQSPTTSTSFPPVRSESECSLNNACNALQLTGQCCPTIDNVYLDCCDNKEVVTTCQDNVGCNALGLQGACCPTNDGFGFLDCCNAVLDECFGGNCTITSATEYMEVVNMQGSLQSGRLSISIFASGALCAFLTAMNLLVW